MALIFLPIPVIGLLYVLYLLAFGKQKEVKSNVTIRPFGYYDQPVVSTRPVNDNKIGNRRYNF